MPEAITSPAGATSAVAALPSTDTSPAEPNAAATPAPEAVGASAEASPPPAPPPTPAGAAFEALARKEREQRKALAQLKAEQAQLASDREAWKGRVAALEAFERARDAAKVNPLGVLEAAGLQFEDVARHVLADQKAPPEEIVKHALAPIQAELTKLREAEAARERARADADVQAVFAEHKRRIADELTKADRYPVLALHQEDGEDMAGELFAFIEGRHAQTGEVLPIGEAAAIMEDFLAERTKRRLPRFMKLAKLQPAPAPAPASPETRAPHKVTEMRPRTVTNGTATREPAPAGETAALTREERIERVVLAARQRAALQK